MTDLIDEYMQEFRKTPEYEKLVLQGYWHYPSKGELPTDTDEYLVLLRQDDKICPSIAEYYAEAKTWYSVNWRGESDDIPIAWQYIIPPKEEA